MITFIQLLQVAAVLLVVVVAYYTILYVKQCWTYRKFRGPTAYPIVGNCYTPDALLFVKHMSHLRTKYGNIFTFFAFSKPVLVVCDAVVVRRILSDPKTFYKGIDYSYRFARVFGAGLVTSNGEKHRKDRSIFGKYFIRGNLGKCAIQMNAIAQKTLDEYFPYDPKGETKVYNVEKVFARLTLRTFMNFGFSMDFSADKAYEGKICQIISDGSHTVGSSIIFNLPMWPFLPHVRIMDRIRAELGPVFDRLVSERKQKLQSGELSEENCDDCLSAMIRNELTREDAFDQFITLACAGHDTTAFFLSYAVYLLAANPQVQEKLYNYLMERVGHKDIITADDFAEMKYLHCVMMETLRLYAIIPFVNRVVDDDVHIKERNITVPAGTTVLIPMVLINRDPEIWDKPSEFRPERFEEKGNDFTSAKEGYFPFGYGARTCIGNTFAQIESGIVLSKLLKKFVIKPDPKFKMAIRAGISLTTFNGINIMLEPRPALN